MAQERIIIGEAERAGLPISAPVIHNETDCNAVGMRWVRRDQSFALEVFREMFGWIEVPFFTR